MNFLMKRLLVIGLLTLSPASHANEIDAQCSPLTTQCVLGQISVTAQDIENQSWKDKTYRELAKSYVYNNNIDAAISLIERIEKPDTKAMTIRGIGFAAADKKWNDKARYDDLFEKLNVQTAKITDPAAHGIALTYIAMAQALAGDDLGATTTAKTMTNSALRNKAYAESAEIQAEHNRYAAAIKSIALIDTESFRNKAYKLISKIMAQQNMMDESYDAATKITNTYMRAESLLLIVNNENPEERAQ